MYNLIGLIGIIMLALGISIIICQYNLKQIADKEFKNSTVKARSEYESLRKYPFDYKGLKKILKDNSLDSSKIFKLKKLQDVLSIIIIIITIFQFFLIDKMK